MIHCFHFFPLYINFYLFIYFLLDDATTLHNLTKLTTTLIDEIDVDSWTIDDYEEPKYFQTYPPSFDVKQALILEEKHDLNIVFRSFLIEDKIMEIPLCRMISMQVVKPTLMNDILKLRGDF